MKADALSTAVRVTRALLVLVLALGPASLASAQVDARSSPTGPTRSEETFTGPYARLSVAIGRIDFDIDGTDTDNEAAGGFGVTGGYRVLPWLSTEFDFQFLGGNQNVKINGNKEDGQFFAFTFGPKLYPLGLVEVQSIPDTIQPYAFVGIGGGEAKIGSDDKSTFAARFILGIDFWLDDHIGFFVEGGGFATDDDDLDGAGVFSLGAQYRF